MISLRDLRPDDEEMIRNWRNLPEVARYMYSDHYIAPEEHDKWFQNMLLDLTRRYWIISYDRQDVGLTNLYDIDKINRRCYWAIYIANPQVWRKGVGSGAGYLVLQYVFDRLGFNRLCCEALALNQAAIGMYRNLGFSQKGYFRQHIVKSGQPLDVVSLVILREEWESRRGDVEKRLSEKGLL